jgi:chorismate synthase
MTTGAPIIVRAVVKPTPSISKAQKSVNLQKMTEEELVIHGRHDPCIVPRAVPVVESAVAFALLDLMA